MIKNPSQGPGSIWNSIHPERPPMPPFPPMSDFNLITRADVPLSPVAAAFAACLKAKTLQWFRS